MNATELAHRFHSTYEKLALDPKWKREGGLMAEVVRQMGDVAITYDPQHDWVTVDGKDYLGVAAVRMALVELGKPK